jgi:hypothetical protein
MGDGDIITGHLMAPGYSNWAAYRLDDIWEMVRDEDGRVNWSQYYAWRRMARLCEEEADQLDKAVNQLIERWPDRPGTAAEAFKTFVGGMTSSMRETGAAATANADALHELTIKLLTARAQIATLIEQRTAYHQAEQQMIEYTAAVGRPRPDQPIQAPPPMPQQPPDYWWEHLDRRARNVMAEADSAIAAEATRFQRPPPYRPIWTDGPDPGPDETGELNTALPSDSPEPMTVGRIHAPQSGIQDPSLHELPPVLDGEPISNGPHAVDPVATIDPRGLHPAPTRDVSAPNSPYPLGGVIGGPKQTTNRSTVPAHGPTTRPGITAPRPTPGPSGGLGPVIPPPMASRPAGSAGATVVPAGRATSHYRRRRAKDPDDPWAVSEGVPAILEPSLEPTTHEPGPGVIGIDR